jgi:hypothetical protein
MSMNDDRHIAKAADRLGAVHLHSAGTKRLTFTYWFAHGSMHAYTLSA